MSLKPAGTGERMATLEVALLGRGYKVAICEQMEDPRRAKGLVSRDVVRVVTPGTVVEDSLLLAGANDLDGLFERNVLVVVTGLGLGGRREDRLGQPGGIRQTRRQRHAAHRLRRLVLLPAAAREVATHHRLDR